MAQKSRRDARPLAAVMKYVQRWVRNRSTRQVYWIRLDPVMGLTGDSYLCLSQNRINELHQKYRVTFYICVY